MPGHVHPWQRGGLVAVGVRAPGEPTSRAFVDPRGQGTRRLRWPAVPLGHPTWSSVWAVSGLLRVSGPACRPRRRTCNMVAADPHGLGSCRAPSAPASASSAPTSSPHRARGTGEQPEPGPGDRQGVGQDRSSPGARTRNRRRPPRGPSPRGRPPQREAGPELSLCLWSKVQPQSRQPGHATPAISA